MGIAGQPSPGQMILEAIYLVVDFSGQNAGTAPGGRNTVVAFFNYGDNANRIHEKIADQIRIDQAQPGLKVTFFDSPGYY